MSMKALGVNSSFLSIVVLGLTPQGLALLRTFSKAGYNVFAVGFRKDVGIYSKYGSIHVIDSLGDLKQLLIRNLSGDELIHITSDIILNYVIDFFPELYNQFKIYPKYESARIFRDKLKTTELAKTLNIPYPATFTLDNLESIENAKFPLILKWNKTFEMVPFKTDIVYSFQSLLCLITKYQTKNFIIQDYIWGIPESDISYGGYWLNGIEKVGVVIKQKRQYPLKGGLASKVEEVRGKVSEEIKNYAYKLLRTTQFSGFVEVECRIDYKTGCVYLIEVNPRACGWIKILMDQFQATVLNCDTMETNSTRAKKTRKVWINIVRDVRAIISLMVHSPELIDIREIIDDYVGNNSIKDIFELSDLKPFLLQVRKMFF